MACALTSSAVFAVPVNLGSAADYTLLATGTDIWYGQAMYGDMGLGSEAYIYGKVGVRNTLNMGQGAVVYGDADVGALKMDGDNRITGTATVQGSGFWDALYSEVKLASQEALALGANGVERGAINASQIFERTSDLSVFNITGLNLGVGNRLTLKGNADDMFIVNVGSDGFMLGAGAAIILDGVSADNVLFNMYGILNAGNMNVAAGEMQGTYISPDAHMQLGDGLIFDNVRFLTAGILGNLQTVYGITPPKVDVPEPSMLLLFGLGLFGLGVMRRLH